MNVRARLAPVAFGVLVGLVAWVALGRVAGAQTGDRFGAYNLRSSASGYQHIFGGQVDSSVPDAATTFETGGIGYGRGAIAWPGSLLGNAGSLLIVLSGGQIPPDAQDPVRTLNDPVRAEARSPSGPAEASYDTAPGIVMKATANDTGATAVGSAPRSEVPGSATLGSSAANAFSRLDADRALSGASSTVSDIDLGGVLHIDSITSTANASSDGSKATGDAATTVQGVKVAGQPATIDQHGLTLGTSSTPLNEVANQAAKQALEQAQIEIVVSQPVITTKGASSTASAGSVLISLGGGQAAFVFGGATASATAAPAFDEALLSGDDATLGPAGSGGSGGLASGPVATGSSVSNGGSTPARNVTLKPTLVSSFGTANPLWLALLAGFLGWLTAAALRRLGLGILELGPACDEGDLL